MDIKKQIKSTPILGFAIRWTNSLLRLNNTKHRLHILEQKFLTLNIELSKLNTQHQKLNTQHQTLRTDFNTLNNSHKILRTDFNALNNSHKILRTDFNNLNNSHKILRTDFNILNEKHKKQEQFAYDLVRKQIVNQTIYFHEKIDNFLENNPTPNTYNPTPNTNKLFLDEYYLEFENKFRGSRESILKRYKEYLKFIPNILNHETLNLNPETRTLDIGCGRAEWVELLQNKGIDAHGVDLNDAMVEVGIQNGVENLKVQDAFEYLKDTPQNSFELITAFHIIEHIPFEKLITLLQLIKKAAKDGATILLETPNPQNLQVAACNFYNDPTHLNPLPAPVIKFLVEYLGFEEVQIHYLNPIKGIGTQNSGFGTHRSTIQNPETRFPNPSEAQDYLISAKKKANKKQLLVDISFYHRCNLGTGIHKVVEQQLKALQQLNQNQYEIIPVYQDHKKNNFIPTPNTNNIAPSTYNLTPSTILYSADLSPSDIQKAIDSGLYQSYKQKGAKIAFLVHDILPIQYPEFFADGQKQIHETYIKNISEISDIIITTTKTGKKELKNYLKQNNLTIPKIKSIHLGTTPNTHNLTPNTYNLTPNTSETKFLIVGTIEPRKAHAQLIKAFDTIWHNTLPPNTYNLAPNTPLPTLTIVGKKGWSVEQTIDMIETHPLLNKNLFYKSYVSDEELQQLYKESDCIIVPSYAEGFGLPLIEAASYSKPIIARDLEVFKEIMQDYPLYFKNTKDPQDIVDKINQFITSPVEPNTSHIPHNTYNIKHNTYNLTWEENAKKLLEVLGVRR